MRLPSQKFLNIYLRYGLLEANLNTKCEALRLWGRIEIIALEDVVVTSIRIHGQVVSTHFRIPQGIVCDRQ